MAEILFCGRESMCEPCIRIKDDYEGRKDVCVAVGTVSMRQDAVTLSEGAIRDLTIDAIAASADDGCSVPRELGDAAVESVKQLISNQERIS